jgi:glycosyltransferase involved in cell wall biosynthesis
MRYLPKIDMPRIFAHTLVKNESRWIWFALMSVLDFVDRIMVWDTGSDDSTPDIIRLIDSPKIKFKQIGPVDAAGHTEARQAMLDQTQADWILILDGDEIWWRESLIRCSQLITHNSNLSALISPFINPVGDIYHYQDPKRSRYRIGSYHGAYNIRLINRSIPGLHVANPHGRQEYRDNREVAVQDFPADSLKLADKPYLHLTHLPRSVSPQTDKNTLKRGFKYRFELGRRFSRKFVYPEVFYLPRPEIVPDPWFVRSSGYVAKSLIYEPARVIKNILIKKENQGY